MKYVKYFIAILAAAMVSVACETDMEKAQLNPESEFTTPVLSDITDLVISKATGEEVVTFISTPVDFGQPVEVSYVLTMVYGDQSDRLATSTSPVIKVTKSNINNVAVNSLGIEANSSATVEAYVTAYVGTSSVSTFASNTISFGITTYKTAFNAIYLVGDLSGNTWAPDMAPSLYETEPGSKVYSAVIDFRGGSGNFKLLKTREGGWDGSNQYNDEMLNKSASTNVINGDDSNNFKVASLGIYEMNVDMANTSSIVFTANPIDRMVLFGSFDDWDKEGGIDLVYNAAGNYWKSVKPVEKDEKFKVCYVVDKEITWLAAVGGEVENLDGISEDVTKPSFLGDADDITMAATNYVYVYADRTPWVVGYAAK